MDKKNKLNFLHICDYASFGEAGKLNILGIFENINSLKFPYQHPQFFVAANISIVEPGEHECVLRVNDPDKVEIGKFSLPKIKININKDQQNANIGIIGQFNGVNFSKPGDYNVQVLIDGEVVGERRIKAFQIQSKNA